MNKSVSFRFLRCILLAAAMIAHGPPGDLWAQTVPSPYKHLATSASIPVADTLSGLNLSIFKTNPLPKHGKLTITQISNGGSGVPHVYRIAYTPDAGFVGADTFTVEMNYIATWPYLSYQGYRVEVSPTLLRMQSDFAVSNNGVPVLISVLDNDYSSAGALTISEVPLTVHGTATIVGGDAILFTPEAGYEGTAHFNYVACDGQNHCKTGQASVGVNDGPPPANSLLRVTTAKNTPLSVPLTYKDYVLQQPPGNGHVSLNNGQAFLYTPSPNFTGTDQFVLATSVNGSMSLKTIQVMVANANAPNRMAMDDVAFTPKGQPITFNVRANDVGKLTVKSWTAPSPQIGTLSATNASGNVTFTPHPDFSGIATFSYKIGNNFVPDLEVASVQVVVGNLPPAQSDYAMTTASGTPFVLQHPVPFTDFQFTISSAPTHGSCVVYPGYTTQTIQGQPISGNNLIVYTPQSGFWGTDEITLQYCVAANAACQDVTIHMEVVESQQPTCVADCVWAGDANNDGIVNHRDLLPLGYAIGMEGPSRTQGATDWLAQSATDWANPFVKMNADLKHLDSDGDGVITLSDTSAIHRFYGKTHQLSPQVPVASKGLPFKIKMLTPSHPGVGDLVQMEVSLGTVSKPITHLYGFSYELTLTPEIQDSALQMIYYDNSWLNLNSPSVWISKSPEMHRLQTSFTRTGGISGSGFGPVGRVEFIITDILDVGKPGQSPVARVLLHNAEGLTDAGELVAAERTEMVIPLRDKASTVASVGAEDLLLYPTPVQHALTLHLNGTDTMTAIEVLDATGRLMVQCLQPGAERHILDISSLPPGLYMVRVQTTTGQVMKKMQVTR